MKQDKYEINNALQDYKRRLRLTQMSLELMEGNYDELKAHRDSLIDEIKQKDLEIQRLKAERNKCQYCDGICKQECVK